MSLSTGLIATALLALVACGPGDSDGDGLDDDLEESFGTDPDLADTDGDGLTDLEEYEGGTSGTAWDSDGDGYGDYDEVQEGTDPTDPESRIYQGGWPYNPDKGEMLDPGWEEDPKLGGTMPRLIVEDQFGDKVDLYDFAKQGVDVVLDISTEWCAPCQRIAAWLDDGDHSDLVEYAWWDDSYAGIPDLVNSEKIYWITLLVQNQDHEAADASTVQNWYSNWPHPLIPVLLDEGQAVYEWVMPTGYPTINILGEDMTFQTYTNRGADQAFAYLAEMD